MLEGLISDWQLAFVRHLAGKNGRTAVDDLATVEVGEAVQHTLGNFPEDLLSSPTTKFLDFLVNAVKTSAFAEFHSDRNGAR